MIGFVGTGDVLEAYPQEPSHNPAERDVREALIAAFREEVDPAYLVAGAFIPGSDDETDIVLIWKRGIFVLEIKGWSAPRFDEFCARNKVNQFYIGDQANPVQQAQRRAPRVRDILQRELKRAVWVEARGVLPNMVMPSDRDQLVRIGWWDPRMDRPMILDRQALCRRDLRQQLISSRLGTINRHQVEGVNPILS